MSVYAPHAKRAYRPRKYHHVDWSALRREYDGGRGGSLRAIAERHGIPRSTLEWVAGIQRWRREDGPTPAPNQAEVRQRAKDLALAHPGRSPASIVQQMRREFGTHRWLPTERSITIYRSRHAHQTEPELIPELPPIDGLERRCYSATCAGFRITNRNPCQFCGTAAEEIALP